MGTKRTGGVINSDNKSSNHRDKNRLVSHTLLVLSLYPMERVVNVSNLLPGGSLSKSLPGTILREEKVREEVGNDDADEECEMMAGLSAIVCPLNIQISFFDVRQIVRGDGGEVGWKTGLSKHSTKRVEGDATGCPLGI